MRLSLVYERSDENLDELQDLLIIGDAPPNSRDDVKEKRERRGETYWSATKYSKPTYWEDEIKEIAARNIPVHAFYVDNSAKKSFKQFSKMTSPNANCSYLNVNSKDGAAKLTDTLSEEILRNVGGEQFVKEYNNKFPKSYS